MADAAAAAAHAPPFARRIGATSSRRRLAVSLAFGGGQCSYEAQRYVVADAFESRHHPGLSSSVPSALPGTLQSIELGWQVSQRMPPASASAESSADMAKYLGAHLHARRDVDPLTPVVDWSGQRSHALGLLAFVASLWNSSLHG